MKTSVEWPSEDGAARGARHVVEDQLAEDEWEQWELGVGVGAWSHVDSLAILAAGLTTDFRASPVIERDNLDCNLGWNEEVKFSFPYIERSSSAVLTFVLQRDCPDSTFIFPIAAEAMLVIQNCQIEHSYDVWNDFGKILRCGRHSLSAAGSQMAWARSTGR